MTKAPYPASPDGKRYGECYLAFDWSPKPNTDCCDACHNGEEGHGMLEVENWEGEVCATVCCPLAARLHSLGYTIRVGPECPQCMMVAALS